MQKLGDMDDADLKDLLVRKGVPPSSDRLRHLRELLCCFDIYVERDQVRGGLWKEAGAEDSAHHLKSKAMRCKVHASALASGLHQGARDAEALDDGRDAVNYAVFFTRNVQEGRYS